MEPDFSGWATRANVRCSDGKTIMPRAFAGQDGTTVPLVWQHGHGDLENVLGHAVLEAKPDGTFTHCYFNDTPKGKIAKQLVQHMDIRRLSIWANQLIQRGEQVLDGVIREVSLVIGGANPLATIDPVTIRHSDGYSFPAEDEAIIHSGTEFELVHAGEDRTLKDVYETLNEEQQDLLHAMIAQALESTGDVTHSDTDDSGEEIVDEAEGTTEVTTEEVQPPAATDGAEPDADSGTEKGIDEMKHNVFESAGNTTGATLTHDAMKGIFDNAQKPGMTLRSAVDAYLQENHLAHGITNIESLFPDAQLLNNQPEWDKRRTEWVASFMDGTHKSPFSRVKTQSANITQAEARAKGYVKGALKKEEWFSLSSRVTTPQTVYKKQKLDRDDIIDIVDFDSVAWLKGEMRMMLEEEIARAALVGDGRDVMDEDKIYEDKVRPIASDHELYTTQVYVNIDDASSTMNEVVDAVIRNRHFYKGTGTPNFYTTEITIAKFLTMRDGFGHRLYKTLADIAAELRVSSVIPVEVLEDHPDIVGVIVNPVDYNFGADRGGETTMFDDFDIDYNQYKYLIETRLSGALVKIKSAICVRKVAAVGVLTVPNAPTFVSGTGVITIVATTGVVYRRADTNAVVTAGALAALASGASLTITAEPASTSYYFENSEVDSWTFTRD